MRCSKRYANGLFLCRKIVAEGFYSKTEILFDPLIAVSSSFKRRNLVQACTEPR